MEMSLNVCAYVAGEESRDTTEKRTGKQDGRNIGKFEDAIIGRISETSMYIFHDTPRINDYYRLHYYHSYAPLRLTSK